MSAAQTIVQRGDFIQDTSSLEIYHADGEWSFVSLANSACTCLAYSFGIKCICIYVLNILRPEESSCVMSIEATEILSEVPVKKTSKQNIKEKIEEMYAWAQSTDFDSCNKFDSISESVNKTHSLIFNSKFRKTTRKRKIEKLHPERKCQRKPQDHIYAAPKTKRIKLSQNEDGSFRRKNRQKGSIRKQFC